MFGCVSNESILQTQSIETKLVGVSELMPNEDTGVQEKCFRQPYNDIQGFRGNSQIPKTALIPKAIHEI